VTGLPPVKLLHGLGLLWLSGMALRLTMLAVPPVIPLIQADLHMSATEIGLLSGLPVLLFALAALPGSLLIARLGARTTLIGALMVVVTGAALRGWSWNAAALYAATAIMGIGIAIMQPAMPVLVREWQPGRVGFATAVYSNGLLVGEVLPIWLAAPLVMPLVGHAWRFELAVWSLPVLLIALLVMMFAPPISGTNTGRARAQGWWPNWRDPLIWRLGVMFSSVNATYFASNAFLPGYLASVGRDDLIHGALTALNLGQLPASLLMLAVASKLERRAWPYVAGSIVMTISLAGLVFMVGALTILWAALLGFACGAMLVLGLTLPPLLCGHENVGRTSAAMFTLSYTIAVAAALACGAAWDVSGIASMAFVPIGLCTLALSVSALMLKARRQLR
jgi:MFS transporter, CP family, cyanate transporter